MKEEIIACILNLRNSYDEASCLMEFSAIENYLNNKFPEKKYERLDMWKVIITLKDDGLIKIEDGLTQRITVLPQFY